MSMSSGREQISLTASVFNKDVAQGVDILADLVTNVPVGNLAKEKEGILRKIEEANHSTRRVIEDRLHACAFRDGPLGFSETWRFEGIDALTSAHLQGFVDANYTADRMVLAASGPLKH